MAKGLTACQLLREEGGKPTLKDFEGVLMPAGVLAANLVNGIRLPGDKQWWPSGDKQWCPGQLEL